VRFSTANEQNFILCPLFPHIRLFALSIPNILKVNASVDMYFYDVLYNFFNDESYSYGRVKKFHEILISLIVLGPKYEVFFMGNSRP